MGNQEPVSGDALRAALTAIRQLKQKLVDVEAAKREPIAIVGFACRFPAAPNATAFWDLLERGGDGIVPVPSDRWDASKYFDSNPDAAGKITTQYGGFISGIADFDAPFWGMSAKEAATTDPQQRVLLETTWEALQHAGQRIEALAGTRTGVYVGMGSDKVDYLWLQDRGYAQFNAHTGVGTAHNSAAGRISYLLDSSGPSLTIDTACSSSLVALHYACTDLRSGASNVALVGAVNLMLSPLVHVMCARMGILSPDGRCKGFDEHADGFGRGEGAGTLVLKRLSDAIAAGDKIHGVIRGSAINHNGRSNGLTAPSQTAQEGALRGALDASGLSAADVSFIEAHATGSLVGDALEMNAIADVFGRDGDPAKPCWIGSVKSNIGHLEGAAGVCGVIKVLLSFEHEQIPPHLHFTNLQKYIDLDGTRLKIARDAVRWPRRTNRIAGVSAFGWSGQNAHVILQEWNANPHVEAAEPKQAISVLPISAKSETALERLLDEYQALLASRVASVEAICRSASVRRDHYAWRAAITGATHEELESGIAKAKNGKRSATAPPERVALALFGDEADWDAIASDAFFLELEVFRSTLEEALEPSGSRAVAARFAWCALWRSWDAAPTSIYAGGASSAFEQWLHGTKTLSEAARAAGNVSSHGSAQAFEEFRASLFANDPDASTVLVLCSSTAGAAPEIGSQEDTVSVTATSRGISAALSWLYERGLAIAWQNVFVQPQPHVPLPAHPWQKQRHWINDDI